MMKFGWEPARASGLFMRPIVCFGGGNFDMERILVKWEGNVQYLLETENITTITVRSGKP